MKARDTLTPLKMSSDQIHGKQASIAWSIFTVPLTVAGLTDNLPAILPQTARKH
jgi:hypothetical protein